MVAFVGKYHQPLSALLFRLHPLAASETLTDNLMNNNGKRFFIYFNYGKQLQHTTIRSERRGCFSARTTRAAVGSDFALVAARIQDYQCGYGVADRGALLAKLGPNSERGHVITLKISIPISGGVELKCFDEEEDALTENGCLFM